MTNEDNNILNRRPIFQARKEDAIDSLEAKEKRYHVVLQSKSERRDDRDRDRDQEEEEEGERTSDDAPEERYHRQNQPEDQVSKESDDDQQNEMHSRKRKRKKSISRERALRRLKESWLPDVEQYNSDTSSDDSYDFEWRQQDLYDEAHGIYDDNVMMCKSQCCLPFCFTILDVLL